MCHGRYLDVTDYGVEMLIREMWKDHVEPATTYVFDNMKLLERFDSSAKSN